MKCLSLIFLLLFFSISANAEVVMVPENCFQKNISPCLARFSGGEKLKSESQGFTYEVLPNSIIRWNGLQDKIEVDILQGGFALQVSKSSRHAAYRINGIKNQAGYVFAQRVKDHLSIFNHQTLMLSEYDLNAAKEKEGVVMKFDFLSKKDLLEFISPFFRKSSELRAYLKEIEPRWKKELDIQTAAQTKVLERSVASIENEERERRLQKERAAEELKKVRDVFFYRTFYR